MNTYKLSNENKKNFKALCNSLNTKGYFITTDIKKGWIQVMSHNEMHDTLLGVCKLADHISNNVTVERCPDPKVVIVFFKGENK